MITGKLGLIRTPKEKLVAAILDALRHIGPAAGYHFQERPGSIYHLTIYWGRRSIELTFNQQQALSADTEQGKNSIEAKLRGAFIDLQRPQDLKQAS